jgi:selenocysteine lyase/cysteine desulfurase
MTIGRRDLLRALPATTLAASVSGTAAPALIAPRLSDSADYAFEGTYLAAAYCHPVGRRIQAAAQAYVRTRVTEPARNWPVDNARDAAVERFARLINAAPADVAVVPSTLEGENLVAAALGLGAGAGVVTDSFHYDASLILYGERHKAGMPLSVVQPRGTRIDLADVEAAITRETRLVAVSLVSSATGYQHDLAELCAVAHRKGALVYADVIQAAGAVPIDVRATGVDFCCAGTYKWLMGEFGTAFLYVRPDRLPLLQRVQVGWRQIKSYTDHFLPFDPPGPAGGTWTLGTDTASLFEVSTPNWSALAVAVAALDWILGAGVDAIRRHSEPMLQHLQEEMPRYGFTPLTPPDRQGPYVVFAYEGARARFGPALNAAKIATTLYRNRIRIAPSVCNDMADIDRLLRVLAKHA